LKKLGGSLFIELLLHDLNAQLNAQLHAHCYTANSVTTLSSNHTIIRSAACLGFYCQFCRQRGRSIIFSVITSVVAARSTSESNMQLVRRSLSNSLRREFRSQ